MRKRIMASALWCLVLTLALSQLALAGPQRGRGGQRGGGIPGANDGVISNVVWSEDGKTLTFTNQGKNFSYDLVNRKKTEIGEVEQGAEQGGAVRGQRGQRQGQRGQRQGVRQGRGQRGQQQQTEGRQIDRPSRGRQFMTVRSPDGKWYAVCKDWNVVLENDETGEIIQVTSEGHRKFRFGTANWVYGEEIGVRNGMWWSPDSTKLLYYVFDETPVKDYYLTRNLDQVNTTLDVEGYMKAGDPNPIVGMVLYDLKTKTKMQIDVGEKERDQYIYAHRNSPDGSEIFFNRIDRRHRHLEILAMNWETGALRTILEEFQDTWVENNPRMRYLEDNEHFIWPTEKSMWNHYELRHIDGRAPQTITRGEFEAGSIVLLDEEKGLLFFDGCSGDHPINAQLNVVKLDGTGQKRLTKNSLHHSRFNISPDQKYFTTSYESVSQPPSTALYTTEGELIEVLAEGPKLTNTPSELFVYKASDGVTDLYGILHKPEDFDPNKKYPMLLSTYGGPSSRAVRNTFRSTYSADTRRGYLVSSVDGRGSSGRGKAFKGRPYYGNSGVIDTLDHADGMRYLIRTRPYVDGRRIGIHGHSFGGFMAVQCLIRHPDVFAAAYDGAGPTSWYHYDTIYTERFMDTPQENREGYENSRVVNYIDSFKSYIDNNPKQGKLIIMHGMVDDNVHPNNAWELIAALDRAGVKYESRFFPNSGHGFSAGNDKYDFFKRHLLDAYENEK